VIPRDILQQHRRAVFDFQHHVRQIRDTLEIAAPAHDEFEFRKFDGAAADVHVAAANDVAHLRQRYVQRAEAIGIDHHVILFDKTPDAGDLGHAFCFRDAVTQAPVL
jgi:hypothetical protein